MSYSVILTPKASLLGMLWYNSMFELDYSPIQLIHVGFAAPLPAPVALALAV